MRNAWGSLNRVFYFEYNTVYAIIILKNSVKCEVRNGN